MAGERGSVVVVGAGIVGLCCAAYLHRNGFTVTILDRRGPGEMTSFGNAGGLSSSSATPWAMPGILREVPKWLTDPQGPLHVRPRYAARALPWLLRFLREAAEPRVRHNSKALYSLNRGSVRDLLPLAQWAGLSHLIVVPANLTLFRTRASYDKGSLANELRDATGHPYEILDGRDIREREPELAPIFDLALQSPDNGYVKDPYDLSRGLADKLAADGVTFIRADVTGFEFANGIVTAIKTDRTSINADHIVIAAGVWSKVLAEALGHKVALESQRGYHVSVKQPNVTLNNILSVGHKKVSITPMSSGLRISGTVEFSGTQSLPDYRRADMLVPILKDLMPRLIVEETSEWSGHRPCTPDSIPVIGRSPKWRNAWFAFGHGHQGLLGSAPTGRILSELIMGNDPGVDVHPFRIDRF
jgi:D-amino-acid dehydrogenase